MSTGILELDVLPVALIVNAMLLARMQVVYFKLLSN